MIEQAVNSILSRLDRIDENVTGLRTDMRDVKGRLTSLEVSARISDDLPAFV